jgi:hypothetical protein
MNDCSHHVEMVRIDIPLRRAMRAYFFIERSQAKWDPWWALLFEYCVGLVGLPLEWHHEPVQNVYVARPPLTDEQRLDLARFLRTAPKRQVEEHRTLQRAVALSSEDERKLDIVYFSGVRKDPLIEV